MARITKEQRQQKYEFINQSIWELFLEKGWGQVTYHQVSLKTGIRQSSLQSYHKSVSSFGDALKGRAFPYFLSHLDLSSCEVLDKSWTIALKDPGFRHIIWLLIGHISESKEINELAYQGLSKLLMKVSEELGEEGYQTIEKMIGRTAIDMAFNHKLIK
ncbi:hypothetical protein L0B53_12470 [Vibrio sp. SS-MA-C1-2]|uniref:hypothetical protein n=1 Tax=Vibrio sp. SS-MA-C1-2 TaxID=2908646 RepID=UPI001F38113E|nr:hypothetical protein [Vibrio sp. SS-MA-C1-2]UJF17840.1 hypothetical protein L0B53_12470 [Vibrio sp. SS-MA-C1-2]